MVSNWANILNKQQCLQLNSAINKQITLTRNIIQYFLIFTEIYSERHSIC